jgi:hypothetical protein
MSKATPLEQLPQGSNTGNVQMDIPQMSGSMQPQPQMSNKLNDMGNNLNDTGNHLNDMDSEYQRMDGYENYTKRQFVPQSGMTQPPPSNDYYENPQNLQSNYQGYQNQKQINVPHIKNESNVIIKSQPSVWDLFKENSKMLAILFALFMIIQMDIVQTIIRTFVRMTKVPDNMIFTVSKVLTSIIGVVLFFIVYRNL